MSAVEGIGLPTEPSNQPRAWEEPRLLIGLSRQLVCVRVRRFRFSSQMNKRLLKTERETEGKWVSGAMTGEEGEGRLTYVERD